jgi:hypothetical protein
MADLATQPCPNSGATTTITRIEAIQARDDTDPAKLHG